MPETVQPPEDEVQQLENRIQEVKTEIAGLGDDEKAIFDYFYKNVFSLQRDFFQCPDNPEREAEITAKQQEMCQWLKNQGFQQIPIELARTMYNPDKHNAFHLILDRDHVEGTVAEVATPGFEYNGKTIIKAVINMYARI